MSVFTVVVIIWVIYQLGLSFMKKDKQQAQGKFSGPIKLPDIRSIRETLLETPKGSWREQMQQALEKSSRQVQEWTDDSDPFRPTVSKESGQNNNRTEGTLETQGAGTIQGTGVTQGVKGTPSYEGGVYPCAKDNHGEKVPRGTQAMSSISLAVTKRELVQGVVWSEILGKPRALNPFRGPRS